MPAQHQDEWANRLVIIGMSIVAIVAVVGCVVLDALDKPFTPGLIAIASGAMGLLGGMLIPRPRANGRDNPVKPNSDQTAI